MNGAEFVDLCNTALTAMSESDGLYAWKCRIRKALGVKIGTDCAEHIRNMMATGYAIQETLVGVRLAAKCPMGRSLTEWVGEMRDGIQETRAVLGAGDDEPMVDAAKRAIEDHVGDIATVEAENAVLKKELATAAFDLKAAEAKALFYETQCDAAVERAKKAESELAEAQRAIDEISKRFEAQIHNDAAVKAAARSQLDEQKQVNENAHHELETAKRMLLDQARFINETADKFEKTIDLACAEIARLKALAHKAMVNQVVRFAV